MGFNPLHCGAVVASGRLRHRLARAGRVSIPFIAGQWSLLLFRPLSFIYVIVSIPFIAGQWSLRRRPARGRAHARQVSIPFIAGQWSLRRNAVRPVTDAVTFQSPSLRGSGRFRSWNRPPMRRLGVSIPFIAGQWSLRSRSRSRWHDGYQFQSPSLRGSGRFLLLSFPARDPLYCFNPLHCGAVVASVRRRYPYIGCTI